MNRVKNFMEFQVIGRAAGMFRRVKNHLTGEDGVGVVEIILILVVLIALVVIFKTQLTTLVNNIFSSINSKAKTIY